MSKQIRMTTRRRENPDADAWVETRDSDLGNQLRQRQHIHQRVRHQLLR